MNSIKTTNMWYLGDVANKNMKTKNIIWILVVLLILSVGYISYTEISENQQQKQLQIYQNGYNQGMIDFQNAILNKIKQNGQVVLSPTNQTESITLTPEMKNE